ncbi:hypothetical protein FHX42_005260 [Saccharopolyspora lacisalsi]|uniref:Uncharacterized protein n=1 Tax=Halosaccharopolyspora lacisalsi TaxID=1000566 RepID=A0A839E3J2_9PSEU|nr:hypothetical protein [Halosaccharopolyspora lacisalsi]MBA8827853.1 hypothetical protein [Halosaccharopolyspora lacisalsi]
MHTTSIDPATVRALTIVHSRTGLSIDPEPWHGIDRALMDMAHNVDAGDTAEDMALRRFGAALGRVGAPECDTGEVPDRSGLDAVASAIANTIQ